MKMAAGWVLMFVLCLFMGVMMALSIPWHIQVEQVVAAGQAVQVETISGSEFHMGKRHAYYLHFNYQGQRHSARVSEAFLRQVEGTKATRLLHLPEYPTIFLHPEHSESGQLLSFCLLIAMFSGMMVYSGNKIRLAFKESQLSQRPKPASRRP